jgi:hypothetical protein
MWSNEQCAASLHKCRCQRGQPFEVPLSPTVIERQITSFDVAEFGETLSETGYIGLVRTWRRAMHESDHRHRRLLRARRERPRDRCAAECGQ